MFGVCRRPRLRTYRYRVTKNIHPYGPKDPQPMTFEIVIQANNNDHAADQASALGRELGLMLLGPR